MYVYVSAGALRRQKEAVEPLKLELQVVVSYYWKLNSGEPSLTSQ